jgi:hypothetical protein
MKDVTTAVSNAVNDGVVRPFFLVSIQVLSTTLYLWSGMGDVTWGGHTWTGVGSFGGVSGITSSSEIAAERVTLTLSGIDPTLVSVAFNEIRQSYPVRIYIGFTDADGSVVVTPVLVCAGTTDVPTLNDAGDACTIQLTVETPMVDLQRACGRRYTHDDQQISYPGDKGFQYVPGIQQWQGQWGKR